jgi:hypothetical protein
MIKFLPVLVLIILIVFVGGYVWIKRSQDLPSTKTQQLQQISGQTVTDTTAFAPVSESDRIKILEDAVVILAKKINGGDGAADSNATLVSRVSSLEDRVTAMQRQISQLQTGSGTTTTTQTSTSTVKQPPVYIPLGWVSSSQVMDWATILSQSVTIDSADYPGMTNVQFEARIGNYQGNGTAYARIINTTDGNAILSSQVSAGGSDYTWVTSASFPLASGKKVYAVQLKTNTGYAAQISDAHIKINF